MEKVKLSVCIITHNEEENIRRCLESVKWAEEIIVVDSFSEDRTISICQEYTNTVFQRPWPSHIEQKNFAIEQATQPWILCLDADEYLSPLASEEVICEVSQANNPCDAFILPRHSYYLGRWINHGGWYPDYKLRLFKRGKARWGGRNPHDKLILEGKSQHLKGEILHMVYRDLSDQLKTVDSFSTIIAQEWLKEDKRFNPLALLFHPPIKFFETYIVKRGFLDGIPGLIISLVSSFYCFLKYAKLWELKRRNNP
jgi:glycosyltransferase involved in cell wall biosynthesis